jgi:hypothetical protein
VSTAPRIMQRQARVNVAGKDYTGLRIGFTIEKDLTRAPNHAEVIIYNLARKTRDRLNRGDGKVPVVVEAGYRDTGMILLFAGEMREAFSRPEPDGSWATILRAGDSDEALRTARGATGKRPGVSAERVISEQFAQLKVGAGNLFTELKTQLSGADFSVEKLGAAFEKGFAGTGAVAEQLDKNMKSAGLEYSVQDGQMQVLKVGQALGTVATILAPQTGLEGSPEVDAKGTCHCRVRIIPGLGPGYPVQITRSSAEAIGDLLHFGFDVDRTVYRIEKTRYVGDTHGQDWNAEIDCRDMSLPPIPTKKKAATK